MTHKNYLQALLGTTATLALLMAPIGASAQEQADTPAAQSQNDGNNENDDQVVVTGTRIQSSTFTSPVAIDVLTVEDAKIEGIEDLGGLLQTATAASGSSQVTSAVSAAFVSAGGLGAETIGLRGLAANRTLDLINGRRAGPSGIRGSINSFDINSIPLAGVERVDILKDGASSVYGSDAIAGVINYITDKSDGGTVDFFTSIPEKGSGEIYRASASYGKTFDRARFRVTGDYYKEKELARGDRSYLDCDEAYAFNADGSRADVIDPRSGEPQCRDLLWGHIWIYDYLGASGNVPQTFPQLAQYDYDGSLAANGLPGFPTGGAGFLQAPAGWFPIYYDQNDIDGVPAYGGASVGDRARGLVNFDHPFQDAETLSPEVERYTLMFDGEVELGSGVTAYAEGLYNRRKTFANGYRQYWNYSYGENSFNLWFGDGYNSNPTAAGWGGQYWFSPTAITDINDQEVTIDYMRFVGGLKGEFGDNFGPLGGWKWDAYVQHSDSHGEYVEDQIYNDSIRPYNFTTTSCQNLDFGNGLGVTPGASGNGVTVAGRPCVDVPWFSPDLMAGVMSDEVRNFLFFKTTGKTDYTQTTFEGFISGDVIDVPAGTVSTAIGVYHQIDEINDVPDDQILAGNAWGASSAGITHGKQKTSAIYAEFNVPLIKDRPFFESLNFSGSVRHNQIKTVRPTGESITTSGTNYRLTLDWQTLPFLRLRGSQGTSFRAPGLFEQFLANETSFASQRSIDPCINIEQNLASGAINQTVFNNCLADFLALGATDAEARNYVGGAITADVTRGGGFGVLIPETSKNYTLGAVFTPDWADLSIAVDYFNIEINDEIATLSASQIVSGCYSSEVFASEPLCAFFNRNPAGPDGLRITDVTATFINVNKQENSGVDFTLNYGKETRWGDFDLNTQLTYQITSRGLLLASDDLVDTNGELGEPKLTGFANVTFDPDALENWRFRYSVDYIGPTSNRKRFARNNSNPTLYGVPVTYKNNTEAVFYHGISAEYVLDSGWEFRAGVNNLFDEHPPAVSFADSGNSPIRSQYDYLGRRFFFNVTKKFQ